MDLPLILIRLGGLYCPEQLCSSSSGLVRDNDVACQQGDAPQPAQADDVACQQGDAPQPARPDDVACQQDDAPHPDRSTNVVRALLRGIHSPQRAHDVSACAQALLRATGTPEGNIEKQIRQWWDDRGDEGVKVQQETKHLKTLLFSKKKSIQSVKTCGSLVVLTLGKSSMWRLWFPRPLC